MLVSRSLSAGAAGRGERSVCWSVVHSLLVLLTEGRMSEVQTCLSVHKHSHTQARAQIHTHTHTHTHRLTHSLTSCSMQWQEAIKVLVNPSRTVFKQKSSWKDLGTPRSLQIFSLSRGGTVSAPCQNNPTIAFCTTVVLPLFIVNVGVTCST